MITVIQTLFDTEWGIIIIATCLVTAIIIDFFKNKPKT